LTRYYDKDAFKVAKKIVPFVFVLLALVANSANASLIGDQVTCHFQTIGVYNLNDTCSTQSSLYVPVPATVGAGIEFYPGAFLFGPSFFASGAAIDVGADSIQLLPSVVLTGYIGSFFLDIGSLDWVGEPDRVITGVLASGVNVDLSALSVTFTDHSVHIALENTMVDDTTVVNVQLLSSQPVPVPASLALAMLGIGLLVLHRRVPGRTAPLLAA
jgi:hypothetical protein